jgi:hypothetical protein
MGVLENAFFRGMKDSEPSFIVALDQPTDNAEKEHHANDKRLACSQHFQRCGT